MKSFKVFLGGRCDDNNAWRDDVKGMNFKHITFFDPYKKDWDAHTDIYKELKEMLKSDYVVFYKGGIGSKNEMEILTIVGKPKYKTFTDLTVLKKFLSKLDAGLGV